MIAFVSLQWYVHRSLLNNNNGRIVTNPFVVEDRLWCEAEILVILLM